MGALEYFRSALKSLHTNYLEAVKDLSPEHLDFRPLGKGNSIAFTLWHTVRTEDNVINFGWRQKPTIWMAEGWDRKFGLDPKSQGTGMTAEKAGSIRISDLSEFR
ncbi:MAG TPA: DinB family protein, partial [Thermodesulfobacteriota bacterium]|nr:DinB family protein [Thermodesulfobacteriota bacterium]